MKANEIGWAVDGRPRVDPRFPWPVGRTDQSLAAGELQTARALLRGELVQLLGLLDAASDTTIPPRCAWRRLLALQAAAWHAHAALTAWRSAETALALDLAEPQTAA